MHDHQMTSRLPGLRVGIGSLGAIGRQVAMALDAGIPGLELSVVSVRDAAKAAPFLETLKARPRVVPLSGLAEADVILECAPAAVYDQIAVPAIEAGRIFITMSSSALLDRKSLIVRAAETGARIIVPSGGILGLDALRAAAGSGIDSVVLVTRKPPGSLAGTPYLVQQNIDVERLTRPTMVFSGNALDAARAFPANANVAATLSLAGVPAELVRVEIWADPGLRHNVQELRVDAAAARFAVRLQSSPLPANPRTGSLTPLSAISAMRALTSHLMVGGL